MRLVHRSLLISVLHVVTHPWRVLIICFAIAAGCVGLAMWKLNISTDQNKLFDPDVPFFQDYLRYVEKFPENEAIYVLIEAKDRAHPPAVGRWTALADAITARVGALTKHVKSVDSKVPVDKLGAQGLLFDDPKLVRQNFEEIKRFVPLAKLWAEKPTILTRILGETPLERFIAALNTQPADEETAGFLGPVAASWVTTLRSGDEALQVGKQVPDLAALGATDPSRLGYYYVPNESDPSQFVMLVRVYNRQDYTSLTAISETVEAIRGAVREAMPPFQNEFTAGVTGRPALDADEMRTSDRDSHNAEIIAMIAVLAGLIVMLRSVWLAIAGEIALVFGIGWTFGWATVSIGELNLLSIVFLLALIGIGMDYLVQVLTRYRQEVRRRRTPQAIWVSVFRHVAAPINTACMGAAGAFLVSAFTRFRGAAQLGVIAGGGLLLCLLTGYTVLPALLTIFPPRFRADDDEDVQRALARLGPPARGTRKILWLPILWLFLLILASPFARRTGFNPGLIELQAPNLESVKLVNKLETWSYTILSKNLDVLRTAREKSRESQLVDRTESILIAYDNLDWLRAHENELPSIAWNEPNPVDTNDLSKIAQKADALAKRYANFKNAAAPLTEFAKLLDDAKDNRVARFAARLSDWQKQFIVQLQDAVAPFHPGDLDLAALPMELKQHYVSQDGTFALYVYPREDLWNRTHLRAFVHDIEARLEDLPPNEAIVTGIVPNIYYSTNAIEKSFYRATGYALVLIFILVLIDLQSIRQTLMAVSVLALGLPMLVAILGLTNVDWNFANFFGLPILIGAGHEYGVFMVHRYREACKDPRRVWRRWDVADKALLLCAYVTCSSFGFFWLIAEHRGLKSLGMVMAVGTACIYLATITVLRPLLIWRLSRRPRAKDCVEANGTVAVSR